MTLVEYGDYECPYCGLAYPIVKDVQTAPRQAAAFRVPQLPARRDASPRPRAAEAAEAAGAQGKFWEMHDLLYENQQALDDPDLLRYAAALGLDVPRFVSELADRTWEARGCGKTS